MQSSRTSRLSILGFTTLVAVSLLLAPNESVSDSHKESLYDRIGGKLGIRNVIVFFLCDVSQDDGVNHRFAKTDMFKFGALLFDQVCEATGGPCKYKGKSMLEAHKGLKIREDEFFIIMGHFVNAMNKAGVQPEDIPEFAGVLDRMHDDIVGH